jgi:hypothetical protein
MCKGQREGSWREGKVQHQPIMISKTPDNLFPVGSELWGSWRSLDGLKLGLSALNWGLPPQFTKHLLTETGPRPANGPTGATLRMSGVSAVKRE